MPSLPTDVPGSANGGPRRSISHSFPSTSPLAQASIARDLEDDSDDEDDAISDEEDDNGLKPTQTGSYSFTGSYRRPSFAGAGNRGYLSTRPSGREALAPAEKKRMIAEEAALLRDNKLIPPKQTQDGRRGSLFDTLTKSKSAPGSSGGQQSEADPLLGASGQNDAQKIQSTWDEAVAAGKITTTWQRETKTILVYAVPLMVTFLLQYSLTVASVFTVGHIGTAELGAVSLASMTSNITGYGIYQGLSTSLDTLCSQAYGSGRKKLVGLQTQRMIWFLWAITIPVAIIWLASEQILKLLLPDPEVARLAGSYLRILVIGTPGYAAFEAGKRYVQAQGLFRGALYVLIIVAPFNIVLNWALVWKTSLGFIGAPIAVAISDLMLPIGLLIYVRLSKTGMSCWNGFTRKAFTNWGPMIKLALPGLVMTEAETLAFEVLTFAAAYFGTTALAAQSVLSTITSITWQIPFPLGIASSTRVANLIGATLTDAAKTSTKVSFTVAAVVGVLNLVILSSLRVQIPTLFTSNQEVIDTVAMTLPICAAFQFFDALAANCNGVLRGLGRQEFGGYVQLFAYYVVALPISFGTGFGLHWGLRGLWSGVAIALGLVTFIELTYLYRTNWQKSVEAARARNTAEA